MSLGNARYVHLDGNTDEYMGLTRRLFRQDTRAPHPLLMRPGETPVRVRLPGQPADAARAGVHCARASFPVDAAFSLCVEAIAAVGATRLESRLLGVTPPAVSRVPSRLEPWLSQLDGGCGWYEDDLPFVRIPARLASAAACPEIATHALWLAADAVRLPYVLRAERLAVSDGGRLLTETLSRQLVGR